MNIQISIKHWTLFLVFLGIHVAMPAQSGCEEDFVIKIEQLHPTDPDTILLTAEDNETSNECSLERYHWVWTLEGQYYAFGDSVKYRFRHGSQGDPNVKFLQTSRYENLDPPVERNATHGNAGTHGDSTQLKLTLSRSFRPGYGTFLHIRAGSPTGRVIVIVETDASLFAEGQNCDPHLPNFSATGINYEMEPISIEGFSDSTRAFYVDHSTVQGSGTARGDYLMPVCTPADWEVGLDVELKATTYLITSAALLSAEQITPMDLDTGSIALDTFELTEIVVGSWDPNAIANFPVDSVVPGDTITYTIYFENVGTAVETGVFISTVIPSNLDPHIFDIKSPRKVALQPPSTNTAPQNQLVWKVVRGLLAGEKSWLQFKTIVKDDVTPGDLIQNSAVIRFENAGTSMQTNVVSNPIKLGCNDLVCKLMAKLGRVSWWQWLIGVLGMLLTWLYIRFRRWNWKDNIAVK